MKSAETAVTLINAVIANTPQTKPRFGAFSRQDDWSAFVNIIEERG